MKNSQNKKKLQIVLLVLIAVLTLGIGYAGITAVNLIINGNATASVDQRNFKVYFVTSSITTGTGTSSIDENDNTIAYFDITGLTKAGDTAVATYTVLNDSNAVGADISLQLTNSNNEYFKVTERIEDTQLQAGDSTIATVTVEMIKTPIDNDVSTSVSAKLIATPIENAQAVGSDSASKVAGEPNSFATDSWATIKKAVQDNNTSAYNVGDTKTVTINNTDYTVRLVNKSINENCGNENYSETACGFVVEFAEVVETRAMNSTSITVVGWPATEMREYLNGTFYNNLPSALITAIKPTRVISGYGCNGSWDYVNKVCDNPDNGGSNFISTDYIYLLSGAELLGADEYDTSTSSTHQLEYYVDQPVKIDCGGYCELYPRIIKQYNSSDYYYWLRSATSNFDCFFRGVSDSGNLGRNIAVDNSLVGVAPAFRIG